MLNLHPLTAGTLAQLVEQAAHNRCVVGSNPASATRTKDRNTHQFQ